jgi:hypothetical protein
MKSVNDPSSPNQATIPPNEKKRESVISFQNSSNKAKENSQQE